MSAPVLTACAVVALGLGIPTMIVANTVEARQHASAAADAAALAAADALGGWIAADPCELARAVAEATDAGLTACSLDAATGIAEVETSKAVAFVPQRAAARAGPPGIETAGGARGAEDGWVWPSAVRATTQGFHDGLAVDLAVGAGGALLSPYDGVIVVAGADGGPRPRQCELHPGWWRGPNHTVVIEHRYRGRVLYSSHNHIAPGSTAAHGLDVGDEVRAGQRVADAGMSGCTSGPHSHFTLSSTPQNAFPDLNPYLYIGTPESVPQSGVRH